MENYSLWMDRLGIILNFIAGFMVAPELIGNKRIKKTEKFFEQSAQNISILLENRIGFLPVTIESDASFTDYFSLLLSLIFATLIMPMSLMGLLLLYTDLLINKNFSTFNVIVILVISGLSAYGLLIVIKNKMFSLRLDINKPRDYVLVLIIGFLFALLFIFIFVLYFFYLIFLSITGYIYRFIQIIMNLIHTKLEGENKLRTILISLGIFLFILGNLLQLLAT